MKTRFTDIAPFILLILTGVTGLISSLEWYKPLSVYLFDTVGYSLVLNYILLRRVYNHPKYCNTTRIAVYGLMVMNLVSLVTKNTMFYNTVHDTFITLIILSIVYYLRKK